MPLKSDRKNISRVFRGLIIYVAVMNLWQLLVWPDVFLPKSLTAFFFNGDEPDTGIIMLGAVMTGCIAAWLYFSAMQKKYGIFDDADTTAADEPRPYPHSALSVENEVISADEKGLMPEYEELPAGDEDSAQEDEENSSENHEPDAAGKHCSERKHPALSAVVFGKKRKITLKIIALGLAYTICCQIFSAGINNIFEAFVNSFGLTSKLDPSGFDVTGTVQLAVYITIIGPFAEELIYRGFIMNGLRRFGKVFAVTVSAFVFGVMHGNFEQFPFAFMCGIMLGYAACEYSLWCSVLMHIINNGGLSYAVLFMQNFLSEEFTGIIIFLASAASLISMIAIIVKKKKAAVKYIRENKAVTGAVRALPNIWLFAFLAWHFIEFASSLTPLN